MFASPRRRRRFAVHAAVVAVAFLVLFLLVRRYLPFLTDGAELRAFVRQFGSLGPLVVGLQAMQVVVAPIPGQILAVVAGYLFGAWWGTVYNMIGITIGSAVAFWLSRRFGRAYVEATIHDDALSKFDSLDDDHVRVLLFVSFLVPGLPDDFLCFAGGLTRVPLWQLVAIAVVGRTPGFFLSNLVGEFVGTDRFDLALVLAAALVAVSLLVYLNRGRFLRYIRTT